MTTTNSPIRYYEMVLMIYPHLTSSIDQILKKYLDSMEATVQRLEFWGKLNLAYEIKKYQQANFLFVEFSTTPDKIESLQKDMKFDEKVMRYLLIKLDDASDSTMNTPMINKSNIEITNNLIKQLNLPNLQVIDQAQHNEKISE